MLLNKYFYRKNFSDLVEGFVVPKIFIVGQTLSSIEKILGFERGRLKQGAAFAELYSLPGADELEYYGDTRVPEHRFEERRTKDLGRTELSYAAYYSLRPDSKLIKVIPLTNPNPLIDMDKNWPSGNGAMQFKIKQGLKKEARIIAVIENYPDGIFR